MNTALEATKAVNEVLADFTYKPGWRFRCIYSATDGPVLLITVDTPSSRGDRTKPMRLSHRRPVPIYFFKKDGSFRHGGLKLFLWFLRNKLRFLELHELDEFFKYKGVNIYNPHTNASVGDAQDLPPLLIPLAAEDRMDRAIRPEVFGEEVPAPV